MRMLGFVLAAACAAAAHGQAPPDPRVRLVAYDPTQVVDLVVDGGYAAVVELARDEFVENVIVGNSAVWQVTVNSSGNRVIVKPLAGAVPTDMILVSRDRRYVFMLHPSDGSGRGHFLLSFSYAQDDAATAGAAAEYRFAGARSLFPRAMHGQGGRTVITWSEDAALPAVFAIGKSGEETIVNGRMVGRDYVIEGTADRYVFRLGDDRAVARQVRKGRGR